MAARFAVASGNWSGAIWAATAGGSAGSAAVPTSADDVTINAGTTTTLDGTGCVANSVAINGTLAASASVSSTLTVQLGMTGPSGGHLNLDVSGNAAITCQLLLNASNNATTQVANFSAGFSVTLKGAVKTRWSRLNGAMAIGATSCTVDDATGWQNGDRLVISASDDYSPPNANGWSPHYDEVTNITVAGNAISWAVGTTYAHADNSAVGNFSSNLRVGPGAANAKAYFKLANNAATGVLIADHAEFFDLTGNTSSPNGSVEINPQSASTPSGGSINGCAFYKSRLAFYNPHYGKTTKGNNVYLGSASGSQSICHSYTNATFPSVGEDDSAYFGGAAAVSGAPYLSKWRRLHMSGFSVTGTSSALTAFGKESSTELLDSEFASNNLDIAGGFNGWSAGKLTRCAFGLLSSSYKLFGSADAISHTLEDCLFNDAVSFSTSQSLGDWSNIRLVNKGQDVTVQEIWTHESYTEPTFSRDNATVNRSTSSLKVKGTTYGVDRDIPVEFTLAAGATAIVVGYCQVDANFYNAGDWYAPTIKAMLADTELASYTATSAANGAWQKFSLSIANPEASAKSIRLNFRANRKGASGYCWFSGVPMFPLVNRCRHYGYVFDETNPVRVVNATLGEADETVAAGYAGMDITWGSAASSVAITANNTLQKLYDYTQAQGCLNVGMAMPLSGAGVAGSPVLFAAGDITVSDGAVLNGGGSVFMEEHTISTEFASGINYTFTGGAWSQLATIPAFSGGTLNLGGTGSYAFTATDTIISMTPAAPGTYAMGGITAGGTLDLRNTTAHAITVELPSGTSYTTANIPGAGAITVTAPSVERGLAFIGLSAGSFVRVVKDADASELFIATNSSVLEIWDDATAGSLDVSYMIQKAGYEPIGPISVTVTGAVGTGIQSIPVNQVPARWYQASSGLTINTNAFANATTKKFGLTAASTLQNFASYLMEQWIALGGTGGAFANKPWPIASNGPNSFSWLNGWEADLATYPNTISLLSRDGMRYLSSSNAVTAIWAAILSNNARAGAQARYQQVDGSGTTNAQNTGNMDQLIQVFGDATHGNFDKRNWLVVKIQSLGDYNQAEADVVAAYGTLEDQQYVIGLPQTPSNVPAQAGITGITFTSEPTPVLWHGQLFSVTITDTTNTHSGMQIMQYVRGLNDFNLHDMIRRSNGSKFATVNGNVYGDTLPTPAGVRVVMADGVTPHPDFDTFSADDGATYVPPVIAPIDWEGALAGTTVLLYNDSVVGSPIIDTQVIAGAGGYTLAVSLPSGIVAAGDSLRLRYGNKAYYAGELQGTMTTSGLTFVGAMDAHPIYTAWGLNGSTYDQANGGPYTMDGANLQVDIAAGATTGLKTQLGAWTQHLMTLPAGLAAFYGAWDLLAVNQIRQNVSVVDVKIDVPTAGALFTFTDHDVNYYRSDFSYPGNVQTGHGLVAITYNASIFVPDPVVISGQSVVTGSAASIIAAIPSAADNAAAIAAKTMGARTLGQHIQAQSAALLGATTGAGTSRLVFTDGGVTVEADVPLPGVTGERANVVISGV